MLPKECSVSLSPPPADAPRVPKRSLLAAAPAPAPASTCDVSDTASESSLFLASSSHCEHANHTKDGDHLWRKCPNISKSPSSASISSTSTIAFVAHTESSSEKRKRLERMTAAREAREQQLEKRRRDRARDPTAHAFNPKTAIAFASKCRG